MQTHVTETYEEEEVSLAEDDLPDGQDDDDESYEHDDTQDYDEFADEADALTVAAQKVKGVTLGRGWNVKGASKGKAKAGSSTRRPPRSPSEMEELKKVHPCSRCGKVGHWHNDKDDKGKQVCQDRIRQGSAASTGHGRRRRGVSAESIHVVLFF